MNVLILNASPRPKGNTAMLIDAFKSGLAEDANVVQLNLYEIQPKPCMACNACQTADRCCFSDLDELDMHLRKADLLVWAVPVYNYSVPSPAKAVLDRFQRYYEAMEVRKENLFAKTDRPCILLLSAGRTGLHSVDIIQKQIKTACRYTGFVLHQTVFASNTDKQSVESAILLVAKEAAKVRN